MKKLKIYILQSTHWDREWYSPFQSFRYNLVEMLDGLVETLENDKEFPLFCIDGQTIVLEDYAKVNPENAEKLKKFIKEGRVKVGPWYVMPDEFALSGESLIRNLSVGRKLARKWGGEPWKFGYANDIFGHIAQMPQIFSGFGIKGAYTSRGTGNTDKNELLWIAPDGSECLLTVGSYCEFYHAYKKIRGTEAVDEFLKMHVEAVSKRTDAPIIFFSYTGDHVKADKNSRQLAEDLKRIYPEAEIVFADLSQMVEELLPYKNAFPKIEGELNKPISKRGGLTDNYPTLYGAISSYYTLKYLNDRCQNILEKRIEPMAAIMDVEATPINHRYVELAYEYLLKNQPHDSICGCSIDRVHTDMLYRYNQTNDIADRLYKQFLLQNGCGNKVFDGSKYKIVLYNLQPFAFKGIREVNVEFYGNYPQKRTGVANYDPVNNFKIFDANNKEIPYQIIDIKRGVEKQMSPYTEEVCRVDVYTLSLEAEIKPFGYKEYTILPADERNVSRKTMNFGPDYAENEHIRLEITESGHLNVLDKKSGRKYTNLNVFVDDGEVGDGWKHQALKLDCTTTSIGTKANIYCVNSGINQVSFLIEREMMLPKYLNGATFKRSEEKEALKISSKVTLNKDSRFLTVETEIENCVKDHRMRVLFPTDIDGENYFASQSFFAVNRKSGLNHETDTWTEPETLEQNMGGIIGKIGSDSTGIAIVSPYGIHEGSCDNDERSTLALTLFRAFDRVRLQKGAKESQLQQTLKFKYAIAPISKEDCYGDLLRLQHYLADTDIAYAKTCKSDDLALEKSYISIDNKNIALSVYKCAEDNDGYILRMFNASDEPQTAVIETDFDVKEFVLCNLGEENLEVLESNEGKIKLDFNKWQIKTLRLRV